MFNVREFLKSGRIDHSLLRQKLVSNPERLRNDFLAIATDLAEDNLLREKSLRILNMYADQLECRSAVGVSECLTGAFRKEFSKERLNEIETAIKRGEFHVDSWVLFLFCITLEKLASRDAADLISSVRQIFGGSEVGFTLERQLAKMRRKTDNNG